MFVYIYMCVYIVYYMHFVAIMSIYLESAWLSKTNENPVRAVSQRWRSKQLLELPSFGTYQQIHGRLFSGHYITNPNNALLKGESFKISIHL